MKKILVLMLVLGIASMASAALSFTSSSATIGISESVSIGLTTTTGGASSIVNYIGNLTSTVATLSIAGGADVDAVGVIALGGGWVGYFNTVMGTANTDGYSVGDEIVVATFHGDAEGTYTIHVTNAAWDAYEDTFVITVIPEPMTIGLLGLGSLFLRRRR